MADDSWWDKARKSGWLGTRQQVVGDKKPASWFEGSDQKPEEESPIKRALSRTKPKMPGQAT